MALIVPAASEPQLAGRADAARLAVIIDLLQMQMGFNPATNAQSGTDGNGAAFTSADQSGSDAAITVAPGVGNKQTEDFVTVSTAAAMSVTFKEETSGTVIAGPFYMAAGIPQTIYIGKQLPTANKRLMIRTSAAGNIMALASYHI